MRRVLVRQGFLLVWLAFVGVAAGGALLGWGLNSLLQFRLLPFAPAVFQFALTVAVYPALSVLFIRRARLDRRPGARLT